MSDYFETLSPWADIDAKELKGISPRLDSLEGKKIGLLRNSKRAAVPILERVQEKLTAKYPNTLFLEFSNPQPNETLVSQKAVAEEYHNWLDNIDAVISAYGD